MKILIFKTDIQTKQKVNIVKPLFNKHPSIIVWSVDTEDIDNVLRIEAADDMVEGEVIELVEPTGLHCEVLPD